MRRLVRAAAALGLVALVANSPGNGFEKRSPVVAAACPSCPWGAVADILKKIMANRGHQLRICYNCSQLANTRLVSNASVPPPRQRDQMHLPLPPTDPVDMGVTQLQLLSQAYNGRLAYAGSAPLKNLRAIAMVEHPMYVLAAARRGSFITDLAQIRERKLPVRLLADANPFTVAILKHYGIEKEALESWGGIFVTPKDIEEHGDQEVDVIIHNQTYLANTPEARLWYDYSQQQALRYLPFAPALIDVMVSEFQLERATVPFGFLKGLDKPVETVARSGQVVYGRDDMPEAFAYELAKAMDEESRQFIWSIMPLSYSPRTAFKTLDVPLHPGAARYYRERGLLK